MIDKIVGSIILFNLQKRKEILACKLKNLPPYSINIRILNRQYSRDQISVA